MNTRNLTRRTLAALTCLALCAGLTAPAHAASVTKLNTTTMQANTTDWSATPATTDTGVFDSTLSAANAANLTVGTTALTIGGLTFNNNLNGPVTIGGSISITLNNAGTDIDMGSANQDVTINCPSTLGASQTWNVGPSRTLTVNGIIGGTTARKLTKDGSGTLIFSVANTYGGERVAAQSSITVSLN